MEVMNRFPQELRNEVWYQYAIIEFGNPFPDDNVKLDGYYEEFGTPLPEDIISFDENGNTKQMKLPPMIQISVASSDTISGLADIFDLPIAKASTAFFREFVSAIHQFAVLVVEDDCKDDCFAFFRHLQGFYPETKLPPWLKLRVNCACYTNVSVKKLRDPNYKDRVVEIWEEFEMHSYGLWLGMDASLTFTTITWDDEEGDTDDRYFDPWLGSERVPVHGERRLTSDEIVNWWNDVRLN